MGYPCPNFCLCAVLGPHFRLHAGARDVALYFVHWLTDLVPSLAGLVL